MEGCQARPRASIILSHARVQQAPLHLHNLENNQKWMLLKQHKAEPTPARWLAVKVPAC